MSRRAGTVYGARLTHLEEVAVRHHLAGYLPGAGRRGESRCGCTASESRRCVNEAPATSAASRASCTRSTRVSRQARSIRAPSGHVGRTRCSA